MEKHVVAFRDFRSSTHLSPGSDGIDAAMVQANAWLANTGIRPLNVETLTEVRGPMASLTTVERGVRVWYEVNHAATREETNG